MLYMGLNYFQAVENQLVLRSEGKFFNIYVESRAGGYYLLPTSIKSFHPHTLFEEVI